MRPPHPAGRVRVQLCGDIDALLAEHKVLIGPRKDPRRSTDAPGRADSNDGPPSALLVRLGGPVIDPAYQAEDVTLEELVLAYMGADEARGPPPHDGWRRLMTWLIWRQYRAQGAIAFALRAAPAAVIIVDGFRSRRTGTPFSSLRGEYRVPGNSSGRWSTRDDDLPYICLIVPVALGLLCGAPLVAHELRPAPAISSGRRASPGPAGWPSR